MPNLKYPELFHLNASAAYDLDHPAGATAPHSGIYRCFCGHEWPVAQGAALPSEPHPSHPQGQPIAWRLVAGARRNLEAAGPAPPSTFSSPPGWPPAGGL